MGVGLLKYVPFRCQAQTGALRVLCLTAVMTAAWHEALVPEETGVSSVACRDRGGALRALPWLLRGVLLHPGWAAAAGAQGTVDGVCSVLLDVLECPALRGCSTGDASAVRATATACLSLLRDSMALDVRLRVGNMWLSQGCPLQPCPMPAFKAFNVSVPFPLC